MTCQVARTRVSNLNYVLRAYGDGKLFGEPFGDGPVHVLWLHGWQRRGGDFTAAACELARSGINSVALDLPGFGASPAPLEAGGARHYAELLAPVVTELSDRPLVVVGHSFGGRVATVLAATHPEVVRGVVLTGVPLLSRQSHAGSPTPYRLVRWLHRHGLVGEARMEKARQQYGSLDYRQSSGVMREVLVACVNEGYERELASLEVPVALVWGEDDREVPVDVARRASALLACPHSLVVISGVGHMVPGEAPGELVAAVRELVD